MQRCRDSFGEKFALQDFPQKTVSQCKDFLQLYCYARKTLERFAIKAPRVLKLTVGQQSTNLRDETLVRRDAETSL